MKRALGVLFVLTLAFTLSFAQTQTTSADQGNQANDDIQFTRQPSVNASDHSAEISWETNNRAATFVKYGTDKNNLEKESRHSGGARDHRVVLAELQPNTTYYYQILTQDGQVRHEGQFTTKGGSQSASSGQSTSGQSGTQSGAINDDVRIVEGPSAGVASSNSVDLRWRTNNVAATDVKYGTDANNLDQRAYTPGGSREHTARLDNLQPNTTYHFAILTNDGVVRHQGSFLFQPNQQAQVQSQPVTATAGQTSQQQSGGFLGAVTQQRQQQGNVQIVGGPVVEQVSDTTVTVVWKTNMPASTSFRYGKDPKMMINAGSGDWGERHRAVISQLEPNATYHIEIESASQQGTGNSAKQMFTFRTLPPGSQARTNPVPF